MSEDPAPPPSLGLGGSLVVLMLLAAALWGLRSCTSPGWFWY